MSAIGDQGAIRGVSGPLLSGGALAAAIAGLPALPAAGVAAPAVTLAYRHFQELRQRAGVLGPSSSLRALLELGAEPLAHAFGFRVEPASLDGSARAPGLLVYLSTACISPTSTPVLPRVPLLVGAWGERLDPFWRPAVLAARLAGSRWAWLFNGSHLRVLDASAVHGRRFTEIDLDTAADDADAFAVLWLVTHDGALAALVADSDAFAAGVCRSLRDGVVQASEAVLGAVRAASRRRPIGPEAFEQALTLVYRIVFLLFAESRGLVPMWHPGYRASYSIDALRSAAERGRHEGMWDSLRAISRLASAGCRTGRLNITPFNGRLFDAVQAPLVDARGLDDDAASRAVLALSTRTAAARGGRERIAYRDLGVEQLGAVYEALLDYQPRLRDGVVRLEPGSGERKASGSFYTPQPLARYIVRQTLTPLVKGRSPDEILTLRILDPSMGSGAFLVAACAFLADAYEEALINGGVASSGDLGEQERAAIRRRIAEQCLFGVDLSPMAVQLGRLSLWLATLANDRPLSFLDHHIRVGDSLLGTWLTCLRQPPRRARAQRRASSSRRETTSRFEATPLFDEDDFALAARTLVPARFALAGPSDTVEQVRGKEGALARLERPGSPLARWKRVADLWCADWFRDGERPPHSAYAALTDRILHGASELPAHVADRMLAPVEALARQRRFFHWELEFPEVFFDRDGQRTRTAGFDAIIGNPPWDMVRGDAGEAGPRAQARAEATRLVRFARESGAYDAPGSGQVNRYQLFIERSIALLREGGRFGLLLPGGLLVDHGSSAIRRLLFERCAVDGIVSFDNRRAIFPIHRSVRFLVVTATRGAATQAFGARFGESDPAVLDGDESGSPGWFPVHMQIDLLQRLSGDRLSVPETRTATDLALLERAAARFAPLGAAEGWHARFGRELNATDDRDVLRGPGHGWPVVEGKQLQPFAVHLAGATHSIRPADASRRLGGRIERVRLAYRDVASATNRQTLIAALLPAHSVSTHTIFCLRTPLALVSQLFLCGLFNSFVVNYLVRQRVTTHVTTAVVEQLPIPTRTQAGGAFGRIAALARILRRRARVGSVDAGSSGGRRLPVHVEPGPGDDALLMLNGHAGRLYRLTTAEYAHILSTFPLVPAELRARALAAYERELRDDS